MATPVAIVAYLLLFTVAAASFLFINLLVGYFLRPRLPNQEKLEVYECGEPTIGSSFVQFDLRFYVVALLFIIFDVEVAFFFPWATVFGKATQLTSPNMPVASALADVAAGGSSPLSPQAIERLRELGVAGDVGQLTPAAVQQAAGQLATTSLWDIGVFFAVLMVGFAYVWKRGDLDWVRTVRHDYSVVERPPVTLELEARKARGGSSILSA